MSTQDNDGIKNLIDQLKETTQLAKSEQKVNTFNLPKEELEQFVINSAGKLIQDSMETIDDIRQYVSAAPESEDIHSLAELYKASTGAIEALNKLLIQQNRSVTQLTVKTMDIESKKQIAEDSGKKITFTREEIVGELLKNGNMLELDAEDVTEG